ncbi:MAG: mannose-6-phosphate isomerase, class I [Candidatus Neomarinimicrobiota bacterium]|nr:MAG: mannose-6-phosphate isomerase, class I [Candidatus Neomarinimicrobiota bacterium]
MNNLLNKPFYLYNAVQHYKWGTVTPDAIIPELLGIEAEKSKPYAELWIGAHPSAPSLISIDNKKLPLNDLIQRFPDLILGPEVARKFDNQLPFLFKILSADEALSIQAHPTKSQAELFHKNDPDHYPDNNHKPEIAIALDSLTALAGFITYYQCRKTILRYPEIGDFLGRDALSDIFPSHRLSREQQKNHIRRLYQDIVHLSQTKKELYQKYVDELATRLKSKKTRRTTHENIFLQAREKYGNSDVGLFSLFFLRLLNLKTNEALCIAPGIPHAYIKGNIIECMANSDNVVRAGLTPKFQDINTLMTILDYSPNSIRPVKPKQSDGEFRYPVFTAEFKITRYEITENCHHFRTGNRVEFFLCLKGNGVLQWKTGKSSLKISRGSSFIIPGNLKEYSITAKTALTIFRVQIP